MVVKSRINLFQDSKKIFHGFDGWIFSLKATFNF